MALQLNSSFSSIRVIENSGFREFILFHNVKRIFFFKKKHMCSEHALAVYVGTETFIKA